jgi:hypothetical protein
MVQTVIRVEDVIPTKTKLALALHLRDELAGAVKGFLVDGDYSDVRFYLDGLIASLEADATIEELMGG